MSTPYADPEVDAFAETRRALLDMIERSEAQLRERGTLVLRQAEERARQIMAEADQRAQEVDDQLSSLEREVGDARARLASLRVRTAGGRAG